MCKGIFITATGTDVGKTYVSALLVKKLRNIGINCGYYKPALSGAVLKDGILVPGDCEFVLNTAGIGGNPADFVSYIFEPAVSPHLASEISKCPIELKKIKADFARIKKDFDYIVVEGAGGIVCPFNLGDNKLMIADVIKELGLDIIVVASAGLGTINSTVLTIEYARLKGINVCGIILNNYDENDIMMRDNQKQVERLCNIPVIAIVQKDGSDLDIDPNVLKKCFKEI